MGDTNYFSGVIKILENPVPTLVKKKFVRVIVRVEVFQTRQNKCISLVLWGNLASQLKTSYQKNDYLLIEGYTSIKRKNLKLNKITITALKVYPFFLTSKKKID